MGSNKKEVKENDFIISRLRSYLKEMAVVQAKNHKQLVSTEYLVYRPKTNLLSSNVLMVFALSKTVQTVLKYSQYGTEHPRFYEFVFNEMPIPKTIIELNSQINLTLIEAHRALEQSKALYKEAESLLYESLGLDPKDPLKSILESSTHHKSTSISPSNLANYTIKTLEESFLKTGRLDSEYYQGKYESIESCIKNYRGGFIQLESKNIKDSQFNPKEKETYCYIELANIGTDGSISNPTIELGANLPTRARRKVKEGDLIVSSIEGSLSSCALITKEFDNCLVSTGFYVLEMEGFNNETLLVLFKSDFFQEYLKKFPSGTILTAISKDELQNLFIPKIDIEIQNQIANYIQKSFDLRAQAKELLTKARESVEIAICENKNID